MLVAAYAAAVCVFSVIPTNSVEAVPYLDKVTHLSEYLIFAWLLAQAMRVSEADRPEHLVWAWIYASSYGLLMELVQVMIPWRSAEALDAVANALGAGVGIVLFSRMR